MPHRAAYWLVMIMAPLAIGILAGSRRPQIVIYTQPATCVPCRWLQRDYEQHREFRTALAALGDVRWSETLPATVTSIPTVVVNRRQIVGYQNTPGYWREWVDEIARAQRER